MKILDIRKTQSQEWVTDVMLNKTSLLPTSIKFDKPEENWNGDLDLLFLMLTQFALSDERHIAIHDPRTPEQIEMDTLDKEWKETYQSLL